MTDDLTELIGDIFRRKAELQERRYRAALHLLVDAAIVGLVISAFFVLFQAIGGGR